MINYSMTKEAKLYNVEKTVSSVSDVGKTGQVRVKLVKTFSHIKYKK